MRMLVAILLISPLALPACMPAGEEETTPEAEAAAEDPVTEFGEAIGEAYETVKGYTYDQKDSLEQWATERLEQLKPRIETLESQIDQVSQQAKESHDETITDLKEMRDTVDQKLDELRNSSADTWSEAKSSFLSALEELERGVDKAMEEFGGSTEATSL